jgi:phenylpropionate dioxygenase-like ring-hydroxylating dioxygenase large terminal subunit
MGMLDHWQPVTRSDSLGKRPQGLLVAGQPVVVFRTSSGEAAALSDVCPHRRMKLSAGEVIGERIRCKYHGWTFDQCGKGESPGAPKLTTCTTSYDVHEEHGLVWMKSQKSNPQFPSINNEGFFPLGVLEHAIPAPLELAVDNFNEIEHSGTVHDTFGYELTKMHEVKVRIDSTEDTVTVVNAGPTKKLNWFYAFLLGIKPGDLFHDHWTTRFSPVHSVFDHWWTGPDESRERMVRWRIYIFFVPQDEKSTRIFSLAYAKSRYPGPAGGLRLVKRLFQRELDKEIRSDVSMLHHLADYTTAIEGLKLSRFDKVLGLTRERINRIYRGERPGRLEVVA